MTVFLIGTVAAVLSTVAFFPQTVYVIKTKDTSSLSLPMYVLFVAGVFLWLVYGLLLKDLPMIFSNGICCILSLVILIYKMRNQKHDKEVQKRTTKM